ncbi:MAG: LolA family protein [Acidimicrobiales bacterium]
MADPSASLPDPVPGTRVRRRRWLIPPALAAVLVAAAAVVPQVASAQGSPHLPSISAQALVQKVLGSHVPYLSGTLQMKADLGLPDLSAYTHGSGSQILSYLSGTHTASMWYGGPGQLRVAVPDGSEETDVIVDGTSAWVWQSGSYKATRLVAPSGQHMTPSTAGAQAGAPPTPGEVARELLAGISPSTRVFVTDTAYVAHHAVYELGLAPRAPQSLVADALIAVDASNGVPLRVELLARNASSPALSFGFMDVKFTRPAASNFDFTPPPGAKVVTGHLGGAMAAPAKNASSASGAPVSTVGKGWGTVLAVSPGALAGLAGQPGRSQSAGQPAPSSTSSELATLLRSATPVSGPWGQGRLIQTALVDVLVTSGGPVLVGAVTPAALEAAVATLH